MGCIQVEHCRVGWTWTVTVPTTALASPMTLHSLSASKHDAELSISNNDAKIYGVELPIKSPPRLCRAQNLDASNDGVEQCKLGASNDSAELRVQILKSYLQRHIYEKFSKKRLKNKNGA